MHAEAARRRRATLIVLLGTLFTGPPAFAQADRMYFPAVDNVRSVLVSKIRAETVRIDMSAWYLTEHLVSIALRDAFLRGVQVRLIGDRGAIFEIDPHTRNEFYWLASQGIPIRLRYNPTWFPEIDHWKATVFKAQRLVAFGSANYTATQLAPASSVNYSDETVLFTTDRSLVGAFLTKFDKMWNDTEPEAGSRLPAPPYLRNWDDACAAESACANYRVLYPTRVPMRISTARLEPDRAMPADLVWGQGPTFNRRLVHEIQNERRAVRLVVYRLTAPEITDALIARARAGVRVQVIVEPQEYLNRKWPEFWLTHANVDRLWAAGVLIRQRRHLGLTHMKMLVTSAYATNASSNFAANWQRDHNYFVSASRKPAIHRAMRERFDLMWNDAAGFGAFSPGPPDRPGLSAPASSATGVPRRPALTWRAAPFATSYDVYLGSSPGSLSRVATVPGQMTVNPPATYSWTPPGELAGGSTFYWKVAARTYATARNASLVAPSATGAFVTAGVASADAVIAPQAVFRSSTGQWFTVGRPTVAFGSAGDIPVPADYDGDGKRDAAVWRPSTAEWWIRMSETGTARRVVWGNGGSADVPVPGDYDGDGRADIAIWRPATGVWWILRSSRDYSPPTRVTIQWGRASDLPVAADYDGDGATDFAVWRPSTATWSILLSGRRFDRTRPLSVAWGNSTDLPVPADFDGDGAADIAVWRPETGFWWILQSSDGYSTSTRLHLQWGQGSEGDVPVPADYDGDGRADPTVWRAASGRWYIRESALGYSTYSVVQWGRESVGDIPLYVGWPALQEYLRR